jgi:putative spermidine/putrescine transport system ATP-binding protein
MALGDRILVMRKGAIAQSGTPRQIYFAPASRFVAEFIGAANIVEADCIDGALALPGGRLPLVDGTQGSAHGPVVAMIRPESIAVTAPDGAVLAGCVDAVSFVGDRQRLTVSGAAGKPLQVDAPNTFLVKAGDRVGLKVDPGAVRLLPNEGL